MCQCEECGIASDMKEYTLLKFFYSSILAENY